VEIATSIHDGTAYVFTSQNPTGSGNPGADRATQAGGHHADRHHAHEGHQPDGGRLGLEPPPHAAERL